jgi:hypothetical protein
MKFAPPVTILLLLIFAFSSCKKSKTYSKTKTELLTQKTWRLVAARNKQDNQNWEEIYLLIDSCRRDDIVSFTPTFVYTVDEGLSKCFPTDSQILVSGAWAFDSNETQIVLPFNQIKTILILNEDTLKYTEKGPSGWGTYEGEYTFTH